jgi:hypothetical protein
MSVRVTLSYNEYPDNVPADVRERFPVEPGECDSSCPPYHLYRNVLMELRPDGEGVYLELSGPDIEFEATPDAITVRIPGAVWNRIIQVGKVREAVV